MKRHWLAGIALTLGFVSFPSGAFAQYNTYGTQGLAPSGYPVSGYVYTGPNSPYQGYTTQPPVSRGWVGPVNGQHQLAGYQDVQPEVVPSVPEGTGIPAPTPAVPENLAPIPQPDYQTGAGGYGDASLAPQDYSNNTGAQIYSGEPLPNSYLTGGNCGEQACGPTNCGPVLTAPKPWFFGAGALFFNRVDNNNTRLAYDSNMPTPDMLSTNDARIGQLPGFEVFAGRYFNCGRNAIVASYWGLYPNSESRTIMPGAGENLRPNMPGFQNLDMPVGTAYSWYDGAASQRVVRDNEFHNVELNILGFGIGGASRAAYGDPCSPYNCVGGPCGPYVPSCNSCLNFSWLVGVRYFRFSDNFQYAASRTDNYYGTGTDDIYYNNNVTNDLVGFQAGGFWNYCLTQRIALYLGSKAGVYGNQINATTRIGSVPNAAVINSNNAYNGMPYDYTSTSNTVSFLGELDAGVGVRITQCWSIRGGYRVLGATGIATAPGQIPYDYVNVAHIRDVNENDSLFLHGAYIGAQYNF